MHKSIAQISSQISSDPPDQDTFSGPLCNPAFLNNIEVKTRKEWHDKAQGVVSQAKAETTNLVDRYNNAVNVRHPQELNAIYANLLSDLGPHNTKLDKLMKEYHKLEVEKSSLVEGWEGGMNESAKQADVVGQGMKAKIDVVVAEEVQAIEDFKRAIG